MRPFVLSSEQSLEIDGVSHRLVAVVIRVQAVAEDRIGMESDVYFQSIYDRLAGPLIAWSKSMKGYPRLNSAKSRTMGCL
jgi:hypothetical protein